MRSHSSLGAKYLESSAYPLLAIIMVGTERVFSSWLFKTSMGGSEVLVGGWW